MWPGRSGEVDGAWCRLVSRREVKLDRSCGPAPSRGAIVSWHRAPGPGAVVKSESRPIGATTAPRLPPEIAAAESGDKKPLFVFTYLVNGVGADAPRSTAGPGSSGEQRSSAVKAQHHSREQWRAEDSAAYRRVGCQHDIHNTADRTTTDKGRAAQLVHSLVALERCVSVTRLHIAGAAVCMPEPSPERSTLFQIITLINRMGDHKS